MCAEKCIRFKTRKKRKIQIRKENYLKNEKLEYIN